MSENELKHFNFDLEKVKDFGRNIEDRKERKKYFKDVLFLKKHNKILIDHSLYAPYNFDREIKREIKLLDNGNDEKKLRDFENDELQIALKPIIKEMKLRLGVSVPGKKVALITRKLIKDGWNAKKDSVWVTLRKLGYVEGKRI